MIFILIGIISASLASFSNTVISFYLGNKLDVLRSTCPNCHHKLRFRDLIPVFSYIFLRGHCSFCKVKISFRYFFIEVTFILIAILAYISFEFSPIFFIDTMFIYGLIVVGIIDKSIMIIPNSLIVYLVSISLLSMGFLHAGEWVSYLAASIVVLLICEMTILIYQRKNIEIMGQGDSKLLFVLFSFFQYPVALIGLWIASLIALLTTILSSNKGISKIKVPFGFYLALSFIFIIFIQDKIQELITIIYGL